jgi:hypothetical protein
MSMELRSTSESSGLSQPLSRLPLVEHPLPPGNKRSGPLLPTPLFLQHTNTFHCEAHKHTHAWLSQSTRSRSSFPPPNIRTSNIQTIMSTSSQPRQVSPREAPAPRPRQGRRGKAFGALLTTSDAADSSPGAPNGSSRPSTHTSSSEATAAQPQGAR